MEGVQPKNATLQVNVLTAPDQKKKKKSLLQQRYQFVVNPNRRKAQAEMNQNLRSPKSNLPKEANITILCSDFF